jgi:hypothetical protein
MRPPWKTTGSCAGAAAVTRKHRGNEQGAHAETILEPRGSRTCVSPQRIGRLGASRTRHTRSVTLRRSPTCDERFPPDAGSAPVGPADLGRVRLESSNTRSPLTMNWCLPPEKGPFEAESS